MNTVVPVSYTHLDVYKRQELEFEDNAAVCVVLASDGYPEHYDKGYKIDGLDPVSYTHLDVYKRQL